MACLHYCSVFSAVLHKAVPIAAAVVEFAGGPHAWVTRTYSAGQGHGAYINGERLKVTGCTDVSQSLLVSTTNSMAGSEIASIHDKAYTALCSSSLAL